MRQPVRNLLELCFQSMRNHRALGVVQHIDLANDGWRKPLAATLLVLSTCVAQAQSAILDAYQERDGLANLTIACLTQDSRGTLWVCTDNGLFRFDGFRVRSELLPAAAGKAIVSALADAQGRLWVDTANGLYLRRELDGAPQWSAVLRADGKELLVSWGQRLAVDERGTLFAMDWRNRLWTVTVPSSPAQAPVAQRVALPEFAPFEQTRDASGGPVLAVSDALWFGCGSGLCLWRDGLLRKWGPAQGLPPGAWSALLRARDGSLWARSRGGLAHLARTDERFTTVDAPSALNWAGSIALKQDPTGAIVTATDDGVARWDGRRWQQWTAREGMPESTVRALLFDAEGSLWLGTNGRGVFRWIGYGSVDHWTRASGLPSPVVTAFARAGDGRLWAGTERGIAWFDESARRFRALGSPTASDQATHGLSVDAVGNLWWVDAGKLLVLRPGGTMPRVVLNNARLGRVVQGTSTLYLAAPLGAQRLMASPPHLRSEPALAALQEALGLGRVIADGTQDWLQTGRYLCRLEGNVCEEMRDVRGSPIESPNQSAATFAGPSELWIGDDPGISLYSVNDAVARLVRRIDDSSFGGAAIGFLRSDAAHRVWMGTDKGLFIFDQGHWSHIDRTNGLLWNDVRDDTLLVDPDGTAWIGTSAGATQIHAGLKRTTAPALRLDELQFGAHTAYGAPSEPIAWVDRQMRVTVGTPSIGSGRGTQLEYRLHGNEPWRAVDGNVLQFDSLEPQSYLLEVRAAARLPVEDPGPVLQIPFDVTPPWWLSRLAITAMIVATLAVASGLYRWRVRVMTLRAQRLEALVRERTRELEESRELLREQATKDGLTNVWNRRALMEILAREANRCAREHVPFAVALADIDHFKQVNDTYGHPAGDAVLREFAARLSAGIRPYDSVGRYGGEEFVVVMPGLDITQVEHRARLTEIHMSIASSPMSVGTVTCSFGVAGTRGTQSITVDTLIETADEALYRAKRNGRNRIEWNNCETPLNRHGV